MGSTNYMYCKYHKVGGNIRIKKFALELLVTRMNQLGVRKWVGILKLKVLPVCSVHEKKNASRPKK